MHSCIPHCCQQHLRQRHGTTTRLWAAQLGQQARPNRQGPASLGHLRSNLMSCRHLHVHHVLSSKDKRFKLSTQAIPYSQPLETATNSHSHMAHSCTPRQHVLHVSRYYGTPPSTAVTTPGLLPQTQTPKPDRCCAHEWLQHKLGLLSAKKQAQDLYLLPLHHPELITWPCQHTG
jgi:hypothetical protein